MSLSELFDQLIFDVAFFLYQREDLHPSLSQDDLNYLWGVYDVAPVYLSKMLNGQCSLAASVAFDLNQYVTDKVMKCRKIMEKV